MARLLPTFAVALAACTPSPQETAMTNRTPDEAPGQASSVLGSAGTDSAAENPGPDPLKDSPAEAQGRRILSTAFVRVGPDGQLRIELRDGSSMVLRDVVMGRKEYCGTQVAGAPKGKRYCGGYAEVSAARPGG
jgi:hypothetical protein